MNDKGKFLQQTFEELEGSIQLNWLQMSKGSE